MAPVHKVAVIQLYPEPMRPDLNFQKAETFIRNAAAQGAKLAVLPEYHLTNWTPEEPDFYELCARSAETYLQKYRALAKECNISLVPGTILSINQTHTSQNQQQVDGAGDNHLQDAAKSREEQVKLLNTTHFISNKGEILGSYLKKNLWHPERDHQISSTETLHPVFYSPELGCKIGMLICWDLAFPEAFRELIAQGAQLIIIPSFWTLADCIPEGLAYNPSAEALFLDSFLTTRAFENTCAIVFSNAGGPPGKAYAGQSQVVVPFIGPITRLGSAAEGMSVVELDLGILDIAERNYGVRKDMQREDWHYSYRHNSRTE